MLKLLLQLKPNARRYQLENSFEPENISETSCFLSTSRISPGGELLNYLLQPLKSTII